MTDSVDVADRPGRGLTRRLVPPTPGLLGRRWPAAVWTAVAAVVCAAWVLYQSPGVERMLIDSDAGQALSAGSQLLSVGAHPYIDYFADYGPLYYYDSALVQYLTGGRLIGEILLFSSALTLGYVTLFLLAAVLTGGWLRAGLLTGVALCFVPVDFYWIYPFITGPIMTLAVAYLYLRRGGLFSLALLALSVTLCGLYRQDYGVYTLVAALTTIALRRPRAASLPVETLRLVSLISVFALPWLLTVFLSDQPLSYFELVFRHTVGKSGAMGLPHPFLHWQNPNLTLLYAIFCLWPLAGLGLSLIHRRSAGDRGSTHLAFATVVCTTGTLVLVTASYRADFAHLLYIVPTSLLCLAAFLGRTADSVPLGRFAGHLSLALGALVPLILGAVSDRLPPVKPIADVRRSLAQMAQPRSTMVERLADGGNPAAELFARLQRCTPEQTPILVLPYSAQAYYFAGRPFAGKILFAAPGMFSDADFQRREIEELRREPPAVVLWATDWVYDRRPDRAPIRSHAAVFEYVSASFDRAAASGPFSVFVPRPGKEPEADDVAGCLTARHPPRRRRDPRPASLPADGALFFGAAPMIKIKLARETRNAVAASPGQPFERTLKVGSATRLEVAAAVVCLRQERCRGRRTFRLEAAGESGREVLWERALEPGPESASWVSRHLDLGRFAGQSLRLRFTVDTDLDDSPAAETLALWGEPLLLEPRPRQPLNVLLISIDTLRADRLGCYGYRRDTSPALDALAGDGVRFRQAVSQSPWTTPSHMSLLTSLYPSAHRVNQGWAETLAFLQGKASYRVLPAAVETLAQLLRRHGYRTYADTGGATLAGELGFARGFDVYRERPDTTFDKLPPQLLDELREFLAVHRHAPFFLFFHSFEVHAPYARLRYAEPLLTEAQRAGLERLFTVDSAQPIDLMQRHLIADGLFRREITSALYDGGVRAIDDFLAQLFDELRRLDLWDRTLIVVTSDHGEELGDHDPSRIFNAHGHSLYEELLHVPLILRHPQRFASGRAVDAPVGLIDVAPTILDLLALPVPPAMQGQSLRQLIEGDPRAGQRAVLSEATSFEPEMKALRLDDLKLIAAFPIPGGERSGLGGAPLWERLFDLRRDLQERHSLHAAQPQRLAEMRRRLTQQFAEMPDFAGQETVAEVSEDLRRQLQALGYLD